MEREEVGSVRLPETPLFPPFPVFLAGMGAIAAAWLLGAAFAGGAPVLRAILIALGVLAVGAAMAAQLPYLPDSSEGRLAAAGLWLLGAAVSVVARFALDPAWDSIALVFRAATLVTVLGAIVSGLPVGWRKFAVSLLIVFHLGGLFTAVANVPPPGGASPWLVRQAWIRVYAPYLSMTNLTNGYHFYSPEPGPCALVWFRVEFADGATCWRRIPDHKAIQNHLERRRYGSLATMLGQPAPTPPDALMKLTERRREAGMAHNPPIPMGEGGNQYREPMMHGKMLLASYARFVCRTTPHPLGKSSPATGVKIYHVEFHNPDVENFQAGQDPLDPTLYSAYYQGEFNPDGSFKPSSLLIQRNAEGREIGRIQDPFLFWLIPIIRVPDEPEGEVAPEDPTVSKTEKRGPRPWQSQGKIINFVRIHAGDKDEETVP